MMYNYIWLWVTCDRLEQWQGMYKWTLLNFPMFGMFRGVPGSWPRKCLSRGPRSHPFSFAQERWTSATMAIPWDIRTIPLSPGVMGWAEAAPPVSLRETRPWLDPMGRSMTSSTHWKTGRMRRRFGITGFTGQVSAVGTESGKPNHANKHPQIYQFYQK